MGGIFGVASREECSLDLFFGVDYHSHLGTKRGGMVLCEEGKFQRAIHNISNSPFRTKFERDIEEMSGTIGIGCISDTEPQPLMVRAHFGNFAITTVGRINNVEELVKDLFETGNATFLEMSKGEINATELVATLITREKDIPTGIRAAQEKIDGSMSMLVMTTEGIYAARDLHGRTPLMIGKKDGAFCASFESFAYINLGYLDYKELGPGEVVYITPDSCTDILPPEKKKKVCTFLWVYFGYPASCYEGVNVEDMRYRCGAAMARADKERSDSISGVPDSGIAHAIGYAAESGVPYSRPLVKYTPTWPRSFMPPKQSSRELIAKMKIIPIVDLIKDKRLMLIDDSIVRGTQMKETAEILYAEGAKEVHVRPACPPLLFGCKYLNFSRSTSDLDLIARRVIAEREGEITDEILAEYSDPDSSRYKEMVEEIGRHLHFTSLVYNRLDDMLDSVGIDKECLCTYCWNGKE